MLQLLSVVLHHCFYRWQIPGDILYSVKRMPAKAGLLSQQKTMNCLRSASFPRSQVRPMYMCLTVLDGPMCLCCCAVKSDVQQLHASLSKHGWVNIKRASYIFGSPGPAVRKHGEEKEPIMIMKYTWKATHFRVGGGGTGQAFHSWSQVCSIFWNGRACSQTPLAHWRPGYTPSAL